MLQLIVTTTLATTLAASLTLPEAVSIALRDSPRIGAARAAEDAAAARALRTKAMWLPEISARETYARGNNPVFVFGSLLEQGRFGAANFDPAFLNDPPSLANWRRSLSFRYAVFDQFRRITAIAQSREDLAQSRLGSEAARQELRLATLRAYFGLQLAREHARVAAGAVKSADSGAQAIRNRFEAGLVAQSELLAAEVQLAELRQQSIEAEGEIAVATAALNQLLRQPLDTPLDLTTPLEERPFAALTLEDALRQGRSARPELQSARLAAKIAALETRSARASFLPRVDSFADFGASGAHFSDHDGDHTVGVTLSWNLLDPSRTGRLAEARATAAAAHDAETSAADAVELEIVSAFHRYRAAREKLDVGRQSVAQAESAARIVRDRYEQGLTTITEDLRAQTALLRARMSLLAARFDAHVAYADLLRSTGGLHDVQPFS